MSPETAIPLIAIVCVILAFALYSRELHRQIARQKYIRCIYRFKVYALLTSLLDDVYSKTYSRYCRRMEKWLSLAKQYRSKM